MRDAVVRGAVDAVDAVVGECEMPLGSVVWVVQGANGVNECMNEDAVVGECEMPLESVVWVVQEQTE